MAIKTLTDLQQAFTDKVNSYLQQGFMIAFGDSSRGCYLRTEVTNGNQRLSIYVDELEDKSSILPLKSIFSEAPYLDYYQFVVADVTNHDEIISKTVLYAVSTATPISSSVRTFKYTTDIEEFKAVLAKRKERFEAKMWASYTTITGNQPLLRKMVKGSEGFGKKALAGATILVERRRHPNISDGYRLTNSKNDCHITIPFSVRRKFY